jgi:hypothetical protein
MGFVRLPLIAICLLCLPVYAQYSGGSGTADDPYQIATAADLIALGETPDDYDKHFILTADIDLDPNLPGRKVFDRAVIAPNANPNMHHFSFQGTPFTGVFDGNNRTISHLVISGDNFLAFFGSLGPGGEIRNLGLEAVDIYGLSGLGGLVGENESGSITSCNSTGMISGNDCVGGLAGENHGSITGSHGKGTVDGRGSYVGGIAGMNYGTVSTSSSTGTVTGRYDDVGGLVGSSSGSVSDCYSSASVTGDDNVGGLVGSSSGSISTSYSSGPVSGDADVGGLLGSSRGGSVSDCYSTGTVTGRGPVGHVGGLVGWGDDGSISTSYSSGYVNGENAVAGLVGYADDYTPSPGLWKGLHVILSFWDTEASGLTNMCGSPESGASGCDDSYGKTTAEMQTASTFLDAGWDFVGETENGPNDVWRIVEGQTYPLLSWQKYGGGAGEPNDPYLIYTAEHLNALGAEPNDYDKHFKLTADIDLSGFEYDKALIRIFTGVFDGNGHKVLRLTISGGYNLGLFGWLGRGAIVRHLGVHDVKVIGSGDRIGALVGSNMGSVTACQSSGKVSGYAHVGGLVGVIDRGDIIACRSTCAVLGVWSIGGLVGNNGRGYIGESFSAGPVGDGEDVGGLVGRNWGWIVASYSTGAVRGDTGIGGLVGRNVIDLGEFTRGDPGRIVSCYSTGRTGGVTDVGGLVGIGAPDYVSVAFWDVDTSGQAASVGGVGLTTADMQTASTFLGAGWDFVDETENGTDDIWRILEGQDYPKLSWEPAGGIFLPPYAASFPQPPNGVVDVPRQTILNWRSWNGFARHDVYVGDEATSVVDAAPDSAGVYRGRLPAEMTAYDPGLLEYGRTYYWRIDEVDEAGPNTIWKGPVWSFTTADYAVVSVVDDFESYEEVDSWLILTWTPGFLNGTGSYFWSTEQEVVHGGQKSLAMDYNNVDEPFYSETERTFTTPSYWTPDVVETPQEWTISDADTLTLYFRGEADNDVEPLYVVIEDSAGHVATVTHPDADAVLATEWQKWHIPLADLQAAGVDVASVAKMIIGVGNRDNPEPGGEGLIYIDDILITNRMP